MNETMAFTGHRSIAPSKAGQIRQNVRKQIKDLYIKGIRSVSYTHLNDSAGMFVDYADKDSTYYYNYSALQREECHEELKKIDVYKRQTHVNVY